MKTKHLKWLLPLVLLPVLLQEGKAQTESESRVDIIVVSDTLRWTWTAKEGEEKDFIFSGIPGRYQVWWGDGDMKEYNIPLSGRWRVDHKYLLEGSYAVMILCMGEAVFDDYTEKIGGVTMEMVHVEGGTFSMGATSEQGSDANDDEKPVHSVTLDGFYIGKYEVTQAQWKAVMGTTIVQQRDKANASWDLYGVGDNYPMYYVSWDEAVEFCEKLSQMTGKTYRLPTEAEWEYAARGGQHADGTKYAGSNSIGSVAWYGNNISGSTHPVGQNQPNGLGLYDMSGNVWEWCSDWYGSNYYSSSPSVNPQGPAIGSYRVHRGGSFAHDAVDCRVSHRLRSQSIWPDGSRFFSFTPDSRVNNLGFRVACSSK